MLVLVSHAITLPGGLSSQSYEEPCHDLCDDANTTQGFAACLGWKCLDGHGGKCAAEVGSIAAVQVL